MFNGRLRLYLLIWSSSPVNVASHNLWYPHIWSWSYFYIEQIMSSKQWLGLLRCFSKIIAKCSWKHQQNSITLCCGLISSTPRQTAFYCSNWAEMSCSVVVSKGTVTLLYMCRRSERLQENIDILAWLGMDSGSEKGRLHRVKTMDAFQDCFILQATCNILPSLRNLKQHDGIETLYVHCVRPQEQCQQP